MMTLHDFTKKRRYLWWWVEDLKGLSQESIVEGVLNYGNWDDVQTLFKTLGLKKAAAIFRKKSKPSKIGRQNYRPEVKHYFTQYFKRHA